MARIEEYALIGDTHAAALVSSDGSIDWLCLPRFDSGACFAALLGTPHHGRWLLRPRGDIRRKSRRYRQDTLVLDTDLETEDGLVRITDCMPLRDERPNVVRQVHALRGRVPMQLELQCRFDYGSLRPWIIQRDRYLHAIGGPDSIRLDSDVRLTFEDGVVRSEFELDEGECACFVLTWHPSYEEPPQPVAPQRAIAVTEAWWRHWARPCRYVGTWREQVVRSLITLKALTYAPTGGIVAAATTSLPEALGGVRNWDYRFCWLRDATFTLNALLVAGYTDEAEAWRDWLLRAVAGDPSQLQTIYGCAGERRVTELQLPWLPGYEGSAPVRIGNAAANQLQLDVYGELLDVMHQTRHHLVGPLDSGWELQRELLRFLEHHWEKPDEGIWEVRGPRRHFTHSKMMAWVAFDRGIRAIETFGVEGPLERWRARRAEVHAQVCKRGFNPRKGAFTQHYGSDDLDASLLLMPIVGFLPATDPRVLSTVDAIERELCADGLILRYPQHTAHIDGLPPGEGAFLACTFWLADNFVLQGNHARGKALYERLLALQNDVGLLAEEYDPISKRMLGNFPQAFSHVALINTAYYLSRPVNGRALATRTETALAT